ncbi:MAG: GNAT family N-acetyltransferase [Bacteroidota bacterium]|nr:GNAT family N-acetyltransferase [Bacteroidota bacterium]
MKNIIKPVPVDLLEKELTKEKMIRRTNYGDNELYVVTAQEAPNTMQEIGRLRELSFRAAGGGTGKPADIDDYDTNETPYKQLLAWNNKDKEILGGYRFINLQELDFSVRTNLKLATQGLFKFSDKFIKDYLPYTIELGRSFVKPEFQASGASRKTLFALDNLWDGLGALIVLNPDVKYFFGKVTMYESYDKYARDLVLCFLRTQFPDPEKLVYPENPLDFNYPKEELCPVFPKDNSYEENYKILSKMVRGRNENIPPLINSYMNLSSTLKSFGTAINTHFGRVEETGILLNINDIYDRKKERHLKF